MRLHLEVTASGGELTAYEFDSGPVVVGRAREADVRIAGESVSRRHVTLDDASGTWQVTHHGTALDTALNGVPLDRGLPTELTNGDVLTVGESSLDVRLQYEAEGAPIVVPLEDSFVTAQPEPTFIEAPPPPAAALHGPAGHGVPTLVTVVGVEEPVRLEVRDVGRTYSVGRSQACDMTLPVNSVSRQHAFVRTDGERIYVRDAGARNPVRLNGRPIVGETPIGAGDTLVAGPVEMQLLVSDEGAAVNVPEPPRAPAGPAFDAPATPGGWDAVARGAVVGDVASARPTPPAVRAPPPPAVASTDGRAVPNWAEQARGTPRGSPRASPEWDVAAPPTPQAPPPPLTWHEGRASGPADGPDWDGPPPVARVAAPPPPASTPVPAAAPPPAGIASPSGAAALDDEPVVTTRRVSSQKGWLVAGVVCMFVAVVTGLVFVLMALQT